MLWTPKLEQKTEMVSKPIPNHYIVGVGGFEIEVWKMSGDDDWAWAVYNRGQTCGRVAGWDSLFPDEAPPKIRSRKAALKAAFAAALESLDRDRKELLETQATLLRR